MRTVPLGYVVIIVLSILIGAGFVARSIRDAHRYAYPWFPGDGPRMACWLRADNRTGRVEYYYPTNKAWAPWKQ